MTSLLYTAELDLAEPDIQPFLDWYAFRHAPDLYPIGFRSCACYRTGDGSMNLFDIYEIAGHDIFSAPPYARLKGRDRYAAPIEATRRNKAHTIYEQVAGFPGCPAAEPSLDADWILCLRFDATGSPEDLTGALSADVESALATGAARARLGARTTDHPVYTTTRPRYLVLLEFDERPREALEAEFVARIETFGTKVLSLVGQRLYPWRTGD